MRSRLDNVHSLSTKTLDRLNIGDGLEIHGVNHFLKQDTPSQDLLPNKTMGLINAYQSGGRKLRLSAEERRGTRYVLIEREY
ncbi:MAG: hypothetical protein AABW46_00760 [Nanoarchaeota archaeon]